MKTPRLHNMRQPLTFIAVMGALTVFSLSCTRKTETETAKPMSVDVALPSVDSVILHKEYPAYLTADREVEIVARVNGTLTSAPYKGGEFVKEGTLLFTIEDNTYRDAVQQAQASLATAEATYDYAKARYEAMTKALQSDAVSQMEVVQAKSNLDQAESDIKNARAALATARTTLSYCRISAPFDGHITSNGPSVGSYISGAGTPQTMAKIYDDAVVTVNFNLDDDTYQQIVSRREAADHIDYSAIPITFNDELPHQYTADLSYIAPGMDRSTGTIKVQAHIKNVYNELKSGMYCKLSLPVASDPHAIIIKDAAIGTDQLGKYIYVVNDSNRVVYTPIEIGELVNDTLRIVNKGITPETRYVTKALLKVRDGMPVDPVTVK